MNRPIREVRAAIFAQHHGRRGRDERILVTLAHGEAVVAELLGKYGAIDDLPQPIGGTLLLTRHRIGVMRDQRDQ